MHANVVYSWLVNVPQRTPPRNMGLIRPYFFGGYVRGGWWTSHNLCKDYPHPISSLRLWKRGSKSCCLYLTLREVGLGSNSTLLEDAGIWYMYGKFILQNHPVVYFRSIYIATISYIDDMGIIQSMGGWHQYLSDPFMDVLFESPNP